MRIGTRGSPLALWQANHVADLIRRAAPTQPVELVIIQTAGDEVRDVPLAQIGGEGVFTKAIQDALLDRRVDLAVHSLKDLPTIPVPGLVLAAVPPRGPTGDAFISLNHARLADLPPGAKLATSSLRRRAFILHQRPDLTLVDIRGNVETRLKKLAAGDADGLILAQAGLARLGLTEHITELLDPRWMFPAVGQGALGLECRADDRATREVLSRLDDPPSHAAVLAERAFLSHLGGGCQMPLGAHTGVADDALALRGALVSPDGRKRLDEEVQGRVSHAQDVGRRLADIMLAKGAREMLA